MSKFLVRVTVMAIAAYLVACYIAAMFFGVDIWCQWYYLLIELCFCLCISKQGVYHCKFIKWTAYAIFITEVLAYIDVALNYMAMPLFIIVQASIMTLGIGTSAVLAVRHYRKVWKLKRIWKVRSRRL